MALRFSCPKCGTELSAPEDCAGRVSKCRACGQAVTVPPTIPTSTKPAPPKELSDGQLAKTAPPALIPNVPELGPLQFKPVAAGGTPKPEEPVEAIAWVEDIPEEAHVPEVLPAKVEVPPRRDRQRSWRSDDQAKQGGEKKTPLGNAPQWIMAGSMVALVVIVLLVVLLVIFCCAGYLYLVGSHLNEQKQQQRWR